MINHEFNEKRTGLANAFAAAGAELLGYMGSSSALAAIPDTDPPKYVAAGPLKEIAKLLPAFGDAAEKPTGDTIGTLDRWTGHEIMNDPSLDAVEFVKLSDVNHLAGQSQAAQPAADIDHDEFWKRVMAYCKGFGSEGKALVDYVNSWHRAHLAAQSQATKVQAVPEGWESLSIVYNEDMTHPEEVAYGPPHMMKRLGKWLDKFMAQEIAARKEAPYGETDFGFNYAGVELEEGDKRLASLIVKRFGSEHQAMRDFDSLVWRSRSLATPTAQEVTQQAAPVAVWTAEEIANACVKVGLGILECHGLLTTLKSIPAVTQQAAKAETAEPVGETSYMPGTDGFTMVCFKAADVPVGTKVYLAPTAQEVTQQAAPTVEYVPIAVNSHDEAGGSHPNDKTPADPECQKALDARGDDSGQGLDPYWKWGFRAGWHDHKRTAITQQAAKAETAEQVEGEQANVLPPFAAPSSQHKSLPKAPYFANDGHEPDWDAYAAAEAETLNMKELVNRFLSWPLPASLTANLHPSIVRPIGTHLMNADEAKAMFEYVLARRFRAQGGNTNAESSDLAPTTSTVSAPEEVRNQALSDAEEAVRAVMDAADAASESAEGIGAFRCLNAIRALRTSTGQADTDTGSAE